MHESRPMPMDLAPPPAFDYRVLYYRLREHPRIVLTCLVVAAILTVAVLTFSQRIYSASTVILVEQEEQKVVDIQKIQPEDYQSLEALKTVEQTLQNRALIERVIDANNLAADPRIDFASSGSPLTREQLIAKVGKMIDVRLRRGTRLIDITVEHPSADLAAQLANSLVTEYLKLDFEEGASTLHAANQFLETEAADIRAKLDTAENALQAYREETQAVASSDAQNSVVAQFDALSAKATEAKSQRVAAEAAYRQVQALGNNSAAQLLSNAAENDPTIHDLKSNIAKAETEFADLKLHYRAKHPKFIQARTQLAQMKTALAAAISALPQTSLAAYQSALAAEQAMNQALAEQQNSALAMNRKAIRYDVLARDVESDRTLYETVLTRIKQNTVIKDLKSGNIRVIQPAEVPVSPVKPEALRIIFGGALSAIVAIALALFFVTSLDQSLKTVAQAEEFLQTPVLCAIPKFPGFDEKSIAAKAESFRSLRTALGLLELPEDKYVYLFTSSLPEEGKTFCSLNYALSVANQGFRTLLIDADLRRPMIERILQPGGEHEVGLIDYLQGGAGLAEITHDSRTKNLSYIPAGTRATNPVELLANGLFRTLLQGAQSNYDRIIIDSAPLHVVSDTLLILAGVHSICLVVAANRTARNSALRAVQVLQKAGAPLTGIVFNLLPQNARGDYYYDYSYREKYAEVMAK